MTTTAKPIHCTICTQKVNVFEPHIRTADGGGMHIDCFVVEGGQFSFLRPFDHKAPFRIDTS